MAQREVVFAIGKAGSGKSTICRQLLLKESRLLYFDTIGEYRRLSPPYPAVIICNEYDLMDYLIASSDKPFRIIFSPDDPEEEKELVTGEKLKLFDYVCKAILENMTNMTFAVEEVANYIVSGQAPEYLKKLARYSRHSAINLYATTQRPADIPPVLRSQITRLIAFRQHEPADIDWCAHALGNKDEAQTLRDLRVFKWPGPLLSGKHYKEYAL